MQVIWKAQSSPMSPKSAAIRVWFIWATELTLAISQQPLSDRKQGCWKGSGLSHLWMIDLLPHYYDLGSDFSYASMWWAMMPLLSVISS